MTLLQTFRNSLINLTSAYEIAPKASFIRACETFSVVQTTGTSCDRNAHDCSDEETYFRLRTIAVSMVSFSSFFFFFLFSFPPLRSNPVAQPDAPSRFIVLVKRHEREREREGKRKKMLSTALTLLFPFTLVSSRGTAEQVYRTTRRIMNHNAGIVFRSGSRLTVLNQSRARDVKYKCFGYFQIFKGVKRKIIRLWSMARSF